MALSRAAWIAAGLGARLLMVAVLAMTVQLTLANHTRRSYEDDFYKLQSYSYTVAAAVIGMAGSALQVPVAVYLLCRSKRMTPSALVLDASMYADVRRRRGIRRHHRRPAVRPPRHVVGRRRDEAGPHPLLRQGVPPRSLPPRGDGAVHGRHRRLRQAPGPDGQRRRLMSAHHHQLDLSSRDRFIDLSLYFLTHATTLFK
uniref:CASP-like protein n=1 Tax=Setaria italica TaxID=4555 RepID=K3YY00_SETIT